MAEEGRPRQAWDGEPTDKSVYEETVGGNGPSRVERAAARRAEFDAILESVKDKFPVAKAPDKPVAEGEKVRLARENYERIHAENAELHDDAESDGQTKPDQSHPVL